MNGLVPRMYINLSTPFLPLTATMSSSHNSEYDPDADRPYHRPGQDPTHLQPQALTAHGLADYSPKTAATVSGPQTHPPLDMLFHAPPLPPSMFSPRIFPGIDEASTQALIKTLSDNHVRWHIFFNYKGFHKYVTHRNVPVSVFDISRSHAAHHILAIWALGAPRLVIEAAYGTHCEYQRPAFASPGPINSHNIYKHLGDERCVGRPIPQRALMTALPTATTLAISTTSRLTFFRKV